MTTKKIKQAIDGGKVVGLKDEPLSRVCYDLFGNMVIVSLCADEPIRLATVSDKRRAMLLSEE